MRTGPLQLIGRQPGERPPDARGPSHPRRAERPVRSRGALCGGLVPGLAPGLSLDVLPRVKQRLPVEGRLVDLEVLETLAKDD